MTNIRKEKKIFQFPGMFSVTDTNCGGNPSNYNGVFPCIEIFDNFPCIIAKNDATYISVGLNFMIYNSF